MTHDNSNQSVESKQLDKKSALNLIEKLKSKFRQDPKLAQKAAKLIEEMLQGPKKTKK